MLYTRETLSASLCDNLTGAGCEAVFVKVVCWQAELIIGVCYRCPCCSEQEQNNLFNALKELQNKRVLIMGDFNYPNIDWNNLNSDSL